MTRPAAEATAALVERARIERLILRRLEALARIQGHACVADDARACERELRALLTAIDAGEHHP